MKKKSIKLNELLFYFCYTGVFAYFLFQAVPALVDPLWALYKFCLLLLIPVSLFNIRKLPRKSLFWIFVIGLMVLINRLITGSDELVLLFLLIVSAKGINFESIVKYDLWMKIPALIILPIMYFAGLTDVYVHYRGDMVRHSMGFYNPNFFSSYVMSVVLEILYLRRNNIGWLDILLSLGGCAVIGYFADSRTQMISIIVMCIFLFIVKSKKGMRIKNGFVRLLIYFSPFILAVVSLGFSVAYMGSPTTYEGMNSYTSGRLDNSAEAIRKYGVSVLGNEKSAKANLTEKEVTLDNVYVYIFSVHGMLSLFIYCFLMYKYLKYADSKSQIVLVFIMLCFIVSGVAERTCMRPRYNVFLLYFAYMLYGDPVEQAKQVTKSKVKGYVNAESN